MGEKDIQQLGELGAAKEYPSVRVKVEAFMVETAQWNRIRGRVGEIEMSRAPEWLLGLATLVAGVAASAGIALLVLPHATKAPAHTPTESVIQPGTRPALFATLIGGIIVAAVLGGLYKREHDRHAGHKTDLQDEMDTIKKAWEQSTAARDMQDGERTGPSVQV